MDKKEIIAIMEILLAYKLSCFEELRITLWEVYLITDCFSGDIRASQLPWKPTLLSPAQLKNIPGHELIGNDLEDSVQIWVPGDTTGLYYSPTRERNLGSFWGSSSPKPLLKP